jgi:Na+/H+ antiporter NhaD/arsenite permease-like protein
MIPVTLIFILTYVGLSFGGLPYLRLDRAGIAIIGAAMIVAAGVLTFEEAVRAIDFNTIILLFGMMMVAANLRLAGFFVIVSDHIKRRFNNPVLLLAAVIMVSGVLSAVYVNDTICIFFTPFVLEMTSALSLNPVPYLIALVTSSNIGSVATITGNPQNMLIGVFSGIPYATFAGRLVPVAAICLALNFVVVYLVYRGKLIASEPVPPILVNNVVHKPLLYKTLIVTVIMFGCFFAGHNISMVAVTAAALLLITRRIKPDKVYHYINWNLLMMFSGLFIVIHAVEKTGLSAMFFDLAMKLNMQNESVFCVVTTLISNLVSNVPAVILFKPMMSHFPGNPDKFWLLLAMSSTFAGNLTIIGSVANLIVVEQSKNHVRISFVEYLKVGIPLTILTLIIGIILL